MGYEGDRTRPETAENVARRSYGTLVAFLVASTGDVARAEDALSEGFAAALADWPVNGTPSNPEGWLMAVAKRKNIDMVRRRKSAEAGLGHLTLLTEELETAAQDHAEIPDARQIGRASCR